MSATTRKCLTFAELQSRFSLRETENGIWAPQSGTFRVKHVSGNPDQSISPGSVLYCSKVTTDGDDTVLKVHFSEVLNVRTAGEPVNDRTYSWWIDIERFELVS